MSVFGPGVSARCDDERSRHVCSIGGNDVGEHDVLRSILAVIRDDDAVLQDVARPCRTAARQIGHGLGTDDLRGEQVDRRGHHAREVLIVWTDKEEAIRKINWLETQGIEYVEQPMPAHMIEETRYVRGKVHLPIFADEACT